MMSETSRSLIAAAREGLAPDAAVAARVRAKIAAATGVAAATGSVAALTVPKASTAATLAKVLGGLLTLGAVATAVVVTRPDRAAPRAPQLEMTTAESTDDIRPPVHVVAPSDSSAARVDKPQPASHAKHARDLAPGSATATATTSITTTDTPALTSAEESTAHGRKRGSKPEEDLDSISLSREVELIDLAMVSLRKNVPHAALEAIKAYNRETGGRGQMAEDAAAIEIEARCLQDLEVTTLLDRFDHKWPESAQRERIQTTCFARR